MKRISDFGFDAAGPGQTPPAHGFKQGEEAGDHKDEANTQFKVHGDDAGNQAQSPDHAAGNAPTMIDIWPKKLLHPSNLAREKALSNSTFGKNRAYPSNM
jgi:hypothetical protein